MKTVYEEGFLAGLIAAKDNTILSYEGKLPLMPKGFQLGFRAGVNRAVLELKKMREEKKRAMNQKTIDKKLETCVHGFIEVSCTICKLRAEASRAISCMDTEMSMPLRKAIKEYDASFYGPLKKPCQNCGRREATHRRAGWGDVHCIQCVNTKLSGTFEEICEQKVQVA